MKISNFKTAYTLSAIIAILATIASAGGLFLENLYRDGAFFKLAFQGNDVVTLFVAVPMLIAGMVYTKRSSERAQLVWAAMLGYMLYNYAFYLFGAAFNWFFQIYVALFALSMYALIYVLAGLDTEGLRRKFNERTPVGWIGGYMMFIAGFLGIFELTKSLSLIVRGEVPKDPVLVFALDLSLIVPAMAVGAVWLWRRRSLGYVLAAMMTLKGATYGLALLAMAAFVAGFSLSGFWDPLTPFYAFVAAGGMVTAWLLLRNFERK